MTLRWLQACLLLMAASVSACDSPIVGAECASDFTLCDDVCVNLNADFRNCGGCGRGCGRYICQDGVCDDTQARDAGISNAEDAGPISDDAGAGDFNSHPGLEGCGLGQRDCAGSCVDPLSDLQHCGACDVACTDSQLCSGGSCADRCMAPLTACDGACFDLSLDPDHCGSCATRCTSGICESASCEGAIAGQAVVIGHDFLSANNAMQRMAGNAVFLARGAPVRVLVYRGEALDASVQGVEGAIDVVKREIGRDWQKIDAIEALVPLQLATADVLLVHAQASARKSSLLKLGQQWGNALAQFLAGGGVVVVFEAPSASNDGTYRILEPAQIFAADSRSAVTSQQLRVQMPGLGVALRAPDRYMSALDSVHFIGVKTPGAFVVLDRDNLPVVVQRVIVAR
jgi:Stigma-specific protein, Stig1